MFHKSLSLGSGLIVLVFTLIQASPAWTQTNQPQMESQVIERVNAHRRTEGLGELRYNARLRAAARNYALLLATRDDGANRHNLDGKTPAARARDAGYESSYIGENIQYNYGNSDPAAAAVTWWLGSAGHRRNIENGQYNETGVGAYRSASGKYYFCQVFGKGTADSTTSTGGTLVYGRDYGKITIHNSTALGPMKYRIYQPFPGGTGRWSETLTLGAWKEAVYLVMRNSVVVVTEVRGQAMDARTNAQLGRKHVAMGMVTAQQSPGGPYEEHLHVSWQIR